MHKTDVPQTRLSCRSVWSLGTSQCRPIIRLWVDCLRMGKQGPWTSTDFIGKGSTFYASNIGGIFFLPVLSVLFPVSFGIHKTRILLLRKYRIQEDQTRDSWNLLRQVCNESEIGISVYRIAMSMRVLLGWMVILKKKWSETKRASCRVTSYYRPV